MDDWLGLPNISDATTKNDVSTTGNPGKKGVSYSRFYLDRLYGRRGFKDINGKLKEFLNA